MDIHTSVAVTQSVKSPAVRMSHSEMRFGYSDSSGTCDFEKTAMNVVRFSAADFAVSRFRTVDSYNAWVSILRVSKRENSVKLLDNWVSFVELLPARLFCRRVICSSKASMDLRN